MPVNVTLLFSREHYLAAAEAFLRGIERRLDAGLKPNVGSVASVFISRWDAAVLDKVPDALRDKLGIAIAKRTYKAARTLLSSPRWQRDSERAIGLWSYFGSERIMRCCLMTHGRAMRYNSSATVPAPS